MFWFALATALAVPQAIKQHAEPASDAPPVEPAPKPHPPKRRPLIRPAPDKPKQAAWLIDDSPMADEEFLKTLDGHLLLHVGIAAQSDVIMDARYADTPAMFVTSRLPVQGDPLYGRGFNADVRFGQSRLDFSVRIPTGAGPVDFLYSNNFMNQAGQYAYNLLRFYGQWHNLRVGYTYSAFVNPSIFPATLDWEGPNSQILLYAPQIRYMPALYRGAKGKLVLDVSIEAVSIDLTGVDDELQPFQRVPDGVVALGWFSNRWRIRAASVFRYLVAPETTGSASAFGWGVNLGAYWDIAKRDKLSVWGNTGNGYANYIQDIWGYGMDAVLRPDGELDTIFAWGVGAAYTRGWSRAFSSTFTFGHMDVDNEGLPVVLATTPTRTWYGSGNLTWTSDFGLWVGGELLYGKNVEISGASGDNFRGQISLGFRFDP